MVPEEVPGAEPDIQIKVRRTSQCCGGKFYTKSTDDTELANRIVTSPGHPNKYEPNTTCLYRFIVSFLLLLFVFYCFLLFIIVIHNLSSLFIVFHHYL